MLVATIYKIVNHEAHTGEAFLMTIFGVGGGFAVMTEALLQQSEEGGGESRGVSSSRLADTARLLLLFAYSILSVWFWFSGIKSLVSVNFHPQEVI